MEQNAWSTTFEMFPDVYKTSQTSIAQTNLKLKNRDNKLLKDKMKTFITNFSKNFTKYCWASNKLISLINCSIPPMTILFQSLR